MSCLATDIAFLRELFKRFEKEGISYCVLRNSNEIINGDAHDIDMVVESKRFSTVREILLMSLEINGKFTVLRKKIMEI